MSGGSAGTDGHRLHGRRRRPGDQPAHRPHPRGPSASGYLNRAVAYTYNADNHVTAQTVSGSSGTSVTSYGYDTAGDQTSRSVTDGSTNLVTGWTYGQNGQPLSMTTPDGNASGATPASYTTNDTYDQAGNLATVTGPPAPGAYARRPR